MRVQRLRPLLLALVVAALLVVAISWRLRLRNQEANQRYRALAWALRRGDARDGLTPAQSAYLSGNALEALRHLERPLSRRDRAAQTLYLQSILLDVPWPRQVVRHHYLEVEGGRRPHLLSRAVQSGFARDADRLQVDVFVWNGKDLRTLELSGRDQANKPLPRLSEWADVLQMSTVHLERKNPDESQLWLLGRTSQGRYRAEVYYGLTSWRRWGVESARPLRLLSDRVQVPGGRSYKLVDDEWIEVR